MSSRRCMTIALHSLPRIIDYKCSSLIEYRDIMISNQINSWLEIEFFPATSIGLTIKNTNMPAIL